MENYIQTDVKDGYAILTLTRPEARNALNTSMLRQLADSLARFDRDPEIRTIILTGAEGNFASGADIGEIADKTSVDGVHDLRLHAWDAIARVRKPLIAAVEGYCLGGGFELAQRCDLIVAAGNATFGQPEIRLGLIPGAGGIQRLTALLGKSRAMRLLLTGETISGTDAFDWGIASHGTPAGESLAAAEDLAAKLARGAPLAQQFVKQAVLTALDDQNALALERRSFELLLSTDDKAEGIAAFRAKRQPEFRGR
ncbi:enoyl-CoA hydratase-related protein [Phyllobacterium sp. 22229]|uniref:Enoyl-CoA hydratase n=1 Tax=Phyllobacterium myrsinacearum TaxID=28101 RepID=A0A2S9JF73_9HYPH|nr:enoyl-CoA hydratase-related protein [Phyllobacterium myrsinacearum]PRD51574.1 enoyl-CoA hydratase [Phyllobacterium myrsinacearum]PWV89569.1 short chain enoyl-CoA hydratase [Phyllobacterium myrsinacearum]RZU99840.1 short chain enoyl-CoA hydratase [Phyllobacterium myrsinacearum]